MKIKDSKEYKRTEKGINPITAGAIGATVAVAAGTAVAVLSNSQRRKKIGKTLNRISKKGKQWANKANNIVNKIIPAMKEKNTLTRA